MLSRVACNTFWMSRYLERAENMARFVDVSHHLMLDLPIEETNQWESLIIASGDEDVFTEKYGAPTRDNVVAFLTFDADYPSSIFSCFRQARENARTIREVISSELWRQANELYLYITAPDAQRRALDDPHDFYTFVKEGCMLFKGLSDSTMSHGESWQFIRIGRMLERADKTSRLLDVKYFTLLPSADYVGTPYDNIQWAALLKSVSALEMYRMKYQRITPRNVAEFLVLSNEFPRAMRFCVSTAESAMHAITGSPPGTYANQAERRLGRLCSELDYALTDDIINRGLHEYVDTFQIAVNDVGGAIAETFFGVPMSQTQSQTQ